MLLARSTRRFIAILALGCAWSQARAQAALLMEAPYGFWGALNPTGHDALYFSRICAATPVMLRRCGPAESGVVIARYQGIAGYDWIAIPLMPYLYAVESSSEVPVRADRATVVRLREAYRAVHLLSLGKDVPEGGLVQRGWNQLVGAAYERSIYAFRFSTREEQDNALIARMNRGPNRSHFNLLYRNCSDFSRGILEFYFPGVFRRNLLLDAGITTPRQVAYKLQRVAARRFETEVAVFSIPLVPGMRKPGGTNKSIAQSLVERGYIVPLALFSPFAGAAIVADWLVAGRFPLSLKPAKVLAPGNMALLTAPAT